MATSITSAPCRGCSTTWDVPVYAHPFELPHLTGRLPYPPPDPTVGGGLVAWSSFLFPRGPYNFGSRLMALPPDGRVPVAPDWVALHTPGHTAGHVSLFRGADGVVIAGDAVTTTRPESLISVATQRLELNGPPAYFTTDWDAARWSVQRLAATRVETLLSGHGQPMAGESMRRDLRDLAERFDERARPRRGRYVEYDAGDAAFERRWLRPLAAVLLAAAGSALVVRYLSEVGRPRSVTRALSRRRHATSSRSDAPGLRRRWSGSGTPESAVAGTRKKRLISDVPAEHDRCIC